MLQIDVFVGLEGRSMLMELGLVEQRLKAVHEVLDGASVTEVADRYGVVRQTVHAWLQRYATDGISGLVDKSSRPVACPHRMPATVEARIVELRRVHPTWGPQRFLHQLALGGESGPPGRSSVYRCRVRHGLIDPQARKLQITTSTGGAGPPAGVFDELMAGAQSAEDGAVPLLMCMLSPDAQSGDCFGPSIAGALRPYTTGPARKHEPEPFCTGPENTQLLWNASEEAIGETFVLG